VAAVVLGNLVLYTVGTLWLAHVLNVPVFGGEGSGFALGTRPFLAGDAAKMLAAGMLLPAAWRVVGTDD
jgi:biotin transporter BioY